MTHDFIMEVDNKKVRDYIDMEAIFSLKLKKQTKHCIARKSEWHFGLRMYWWMNCKHMQ